MFRNYALLFIRNLRRQKLFSFINLLGLTVSMASTLLIYLYVKHEFSFDRFHQDVDRIYRVNQTFIWGENNNSQFASTGPGVAYAIKEELPELELIASIHTPGNSIVSYTKPDNTVISFEETRMLAADTNFFRMFSFPVIKGDPQHALRLAHTLVMTASTARKYFGDENPVGKIVQLGNGDHQQAYEVTAVVADTPDNSYIEFDMLLSMESFPIRRFYWSWVWTQLETYVKLAPGTPVANVREKLSKIPSRHAGETLRAVFNTTWDDYIKSGKKWELFLQPMTSIHLPPETVINRLNDSGNITVIYSFIGAAIFIVLLSCVNFMNLSTAQFTRRLKEASMRKVLGLGKAELGLGYFLEALAFCLIALVAAIGATQLLLPGFNFITARNLHLDLFSSPLLISSLLGLVVLMALISGIYPAMFLSAFHPADGLKGKVKAGGGSKAFRNGLVVFQFSVSTVLIICTAIVFQQLKFVSDKDLGFERENLMVLNHVELVKNGESLAQAARAVPGISDASWCTAVPPRIFSGDSFGVEEKSEFRFPLNFVNADEQYIPALNIRMRVGRNFSIDNPGDIDRVILNEAAVKKIGWEVNDSVLGKKLKYDNNTFEIIGVVPDFNYWSLENPVEPFAIFHIKTQALYPARSNYLALRLEPQTGDSMKKLIAGLQAQWKQHAGDVPFDYSFVDQSFAETFRSQQQFGSVLTVMASLAILIAALGLLGMIIYALEQRTKEIGIRKVSGASVWDILKLISKGYTGLITIAFIIGAPLSYWLMEQWLAGFAYRISPSFWIFALAGVGTLAVSILITGYHSVKAALTNPVEVLKDE